MKARLPNSFSFVQGMDLVRIGRDNDGGYLVSQNDIEKSDLLIGLGISDDWSFEEDFTKHNDIEVVAYDASVNLRFWIKRAIIETVKNPLNFYAFKKLFSYIKFFKGNHKHVKKFVGLSSYDEINCSFLDVLNETHSENIFLKIDIEGSEYRFLDDIIENSHRITGLVIEFHDCDLHLKEIERFIKNFKLNLVHIHANNFSPIRLEDGLPIVLELTFSNNSHHSNTYKLPHELDMPNNKNLPDYELVLDE